MEKPSSSTSVHFNSVEKPSSSTKKQETNEYGAFDQVVPPSAFAYASSSSTQPNLICDIFINHRGPDVKHTLAKAIYEKLSSVGVRVFLDEETLEAGDSILTEIQEAMDNAFLHVAIFSKRYAESPWCLAELFYMLGTGVTIIPIFYHVHPFDLRWVDKGIYAGAFAQHETNGRYTTKKLREWKEALQTVSYIDGYLLKQDDCGWVLESLANRVVMAMSKLQVAVPMNAVGLEESVGEIEKIIQGGESVHIVGIVGMGGCGKTTLAKELFNRKSTSISRSSFLYDVRDTSSRNQLPGLQKKLLKNLRIKCPEFESIHEGKDLLAHHLRSLRALIVLDDVDCTEQIDSLLPAKDRLGSGTLVIITTRDAEVLTSWGISERSIYRMKELRSCHAKKLFCSYAFQKSNAPDGFEDLVERALQSCQGLPLSLKVFGGQLCSKPRDYWESQLNEISRVLPKGISSSLEISYDALDPEEQELFLDVACFFIGEIKSLALQLWDGLGRRKGVYSWETLHGKCLVELDEENRIRMHDQLRDLGREIANKRLPYRMWSEHQIKIIQTQAKEKMQVRGIMAATSSFYSMHSAVCTSHYLPPFEECVEVRGRSNPKVSFSLKYLVFNNEHFNAKLGELSRGVVWLRCFNFDHANLSSCLSLESLRVLELYDVKRLRAIWENHANAPLQLRELIIDSPREGFDFQGFPPSIERLKYLKKIVICNGSSSMTSLPNEFCNLNSLEYLKLSSFRELSSLPISFGNLRNLSHLDLRYCSKIDTLPDSFGNLFSLKELDIFWCENLRSVPDTFGDLSSLRKFNISCCQKLKSLPATVGHLNALEELYIQHSGVKSLPETFGQLSNLRKLRITECPIRELTFGSGSKASLNKLREIVLEGTHLSTISISEDCCPNLETLGLCSNKCLTAIETLPKTLKRLKLISSPDVDALSSFAHMTGLIELEFEVSPKVEKVEGLECLTSLETLKARSEWEVPAIQSLEQVQRLKTLELSATTLQLWNLAFEL